MKIDTVDNKIKIIKNGVEMIDFAEPTYVPQYDSKNFVVTKTIIVTPEYDRRPDLLCFSVYGNDYYLDILLKINEVSNPLEVRTGDILLIPALQPAKAFYVNPAQEEKNPLIDSKYIDPKKKSQQDSNRLKAIEKISQSVKNGSKENLPPNALKSGESNLEIKKGGIKL